MDGDEDYVGTAYEDTQSWTLKGDEVVRFDWANDGRWILWRILIA